MERNCEDCIRYLGVLMDKNLSWKHHVEHVLSKISKTIGMLSKLRHFVPKYTLLTCKICSVSQLVKHSDLTINNINRLNSTHTDHVLLLISHNSIR